MKGKHQENPTTCKSALRGNLSKVPQAMIYRLFFLSFNTGSEILSYYSVLFYKIILCVYSSCAGSSRARGHSPAVSGRGCSRCGVWAPLDWLLVLSRGSRHMGSAREAPGL